MSTTNPPTLFRASNLECVRGDLALFVGLEFSLAAGDILQIEGTNGSGKTSLLRILCGLSLPESGAVWWRDQPIDDDLAAFHAELVYLGHVNALKGELSAAENMIASRALMTSASEVDIKQVLEQVGLAGFEDIPCRFLSAGQKRRAGLARLLLSHAPLWILDEPITAIDRAGVLLFEHIIGAHANNGGVVILTSHQTLDFDDVHVSSLSLNHFLPTMR